MAYSTELADQIRAVLERMGIHAGFEERDGHGLFTLNMKLHCKLQSARMLIIVRQDNFSTLTTIPISADENHRLATAEYLTRANYNVRVGNFEMDMNDGEIRYKTYVHAGEGDLCVSGARLALTIPFLMIDRFGDGLLEVIFGFKTPREAFEATQER